MTVNTQKINAKSVLKYALLPGIIPRTKQLVGSGFGYLAFLFASVYRTVRILPATHPYVNPDNIGKFGLIQVIGAAANNIQVNRRNIDQIVIFIALLLGVVMIFLQFLLLILAAVSGDAFAAAGGAAGGAAFTSIFITNNPANDIAFQMLDYVFGIPNTSWSSTTIGPSLGWFGSNAIPTGPTSFHEGLHALFNFYNLAILLVGVLIFIYFVIVVVIETAQTGVPFGRRFSKLYAPFRLIFAVGLLVPLNYGFNAAQYITLYAAKLGSSFATNGWILYNKTLENPTGQPNTALVAKPRNPSINEIIYFSSVYHACKEMYSVWVPRDFAEGTNGVCVKAYVIVNGQARLFADSTANACGAAGGSGTNSAPYSYEDAKKDFGKTDLEVVLGNHNPNRWQAFAGSVNPLCGKITVSLSNDNPPVFNYSSSGGSANATAGNTSTNTGVNGVEKAYYDTVRQLLTDPNSKFRAFGERSARFHLPSSSSSRDPCWQSGILGDGGMCESKWTPPASAFATSLQGYRSGVDASIDGAYSQFRGGLNLKLTTELESRGWGGAGIWYNHIADMNGAFTGAVYAVPTVKQYPEIMEKVKNERLKQNKSGGLCTTFEPNLGDGKVAAEGRDLPLARALNEAYKYFACEKPNQSTGTPAAASAGTATAGCGTGTTTTAAQMTGGVTKGLTSNTIVDAISLVFGLNGLFDMRSASCWDQASGRPIVHPLAQLSTVGKALLENAIRSMAMSVGAAFGGGMLGVLSPALGSALNSASGMFVGIATIGLTAGFVLYYILPFLPFIYFFFAVGSWVKSIFEAMVGVPLWALAHLHIDGDGFSGRAAQGGYFLILEIFLRPIVTLFGLIGGIAIFTAMAGMLNNLFDIVVINTTGGIPDGGALVSGSSIEDFRRNVIDQFFYTIMYAILIYLIATASFKMIDKVPDQIMRWIGSGISTFNDNKQDPTQGLASYAAIASQQFVPQIIGGAQQGAKAIGGLGGGLVKEMMGPSPTRNPNQ